MSVIQALNTLRDALAQTAAQGADMPADPEMPLLNPSLSLHEAAFTGLPARLEHTRAPEPEPRQELLLVWFDPGQGRSLARAATDTDLLALKIVAEGTGIRQAARAAGVNPAIVRFALQQAAQAGLIRLPGSRLVREADFCDHPVPEELAKAQAFTLQWHITQACDLRCRHCYDRSPRPTVKLQHGLRLLDQMADFCEQRHVPGQVSFSGGNPFLHPHFEELYAAALERGLSTAILGNTVPRERLRAVCDMARPVYYQVSLEGLEEHNDYIRGPGHFRRTLEFLDLLKEEGVRSMVMLTLTRANQEQVLPLAEILRHRTDLFTFNRLSLFGEGAALACADTISYSGFLDAYAAAARDNPILAFKDGLLNLALERRGERLFDGCAGHGCGAAFNFLAVLPDGEVHACRKLPSALGSLAEQSLADIYDSPAARGFRRGTSACRSCAHKPRCGGCLAVTAGLGLSPLQDRDPYCFRQG